MAIDSDEELYKGKPSMDIEKTDTPKDFSAKINSTNREGPTASPQSEPVNPTAKSAASKALT
jgi:hypothetical protein